MTQVSEIMSPAVQVVQPQDTLWRASQLMRDLDVGALPVCNGERLLGMLTDRDITIRAVAEGLDPVQTCVSDVMSDAVHHCRSDQDVDEVMRRMGDQQVRRLPVIDHDHRLVGIVSLGDLAVRQNGHIDRAVREISEPGTSPRL